MVLNLLELCVIKYYTLLFLRSILVYFISEHQMPDNVNWRHYLHVTFLRFHYGSSSDRPDMALLMRMMHHATCMKTAVLNHCKLANHALFKRRDVAIEETQIDLNNIGMIAHKELIPDRLFSLLLPFEAFDIPDGLAAVEPHGFDISKGTATNLTFWSQRGYERSINGRCTLRKNCVLKVCGLGEWHGRYIGSKQERDSVGFWCVVGGFDMHGRRSFYYAHSSVLFVNNFTNVFVKYEGRSDALFELHIGDYVSVDPEMGTGSLVSSTDNETIAKEQFRLRFTSLSENLTYVKNKKSGVFLNCDSPYVVLCEEDINKRNFKPRAGHLECQQ